MKNQVLLFMLFLLSVSQSYAQNIFPSPQQDKTITTDSAVSVTGGGACSASVVPPATINGVQITATSSGVVTYTSPYTSCSGLYSTPANSIHMGLMGAFTYTLNFNPAVNNLVFVLTATGHTNNEIFTFTSNTDIPTITSSGSCYTTITGNTILSGAGAPVNSGGGGGGIFTVNTTTPFTTLTISGPGGEAGSLMALCASSVAPVGTCLAGTNPPILSITSITSVCYESTVNLTSITASNTPTAGSVSLVWFSGSTPSSANQLSQPQLAPSGNTYYAAFYDSVNNCYSPVTAVVTITQPVTTPTFDPINPVCYGDPTFDLPILSTNGVYGTWFPAINNTQTTSYTFIPINSACATEYTMQVGILDDFDFDIIHYCLNNDFILEIVPLANSFAIADATFNWETNTHNVGNNAIFNATAYMNSVSATTSLPIDLNVSVTNSDGCTKTKPMNVSTIYCGIQKGISANGDQFNDFFDLTLLNVKQLTIFNRYGMKVYDKNNYVNEWYGQSNDGKKLPDGTYFYSIEFDSDSPKTGWIYLNKAK